MLEPSSAVLGSTLPRLYTPPLVTGPPGPCVCGQCALTPDTSYGFDVIEFARDKLRRPLDPWQQLAAVHGGELLPDGRPRFRRIVILVARQNGKTELLVVLTLYWQFVDSRPKSADEITEELILGTSTKLDYAKESWNKAVKLAMRSPALDALRPARWTRETNGEQESWTTEGARYKIAASNEEGGRSLTIRRLILDELRQHRSYAAYGAAEPATSAVWDAQIWALSNAGDARSVVLNDLRSSALKFIETGEGDRRLGLLEWSAPEDADPTDVHALAMANPNLNRRKDADDLLGAAAEAVAAGGEALTSFKTESMCIWVKGLNPAIDPGAWSGCLDVGDLSAARGRVAACLDVAPDGEHVTLVVAAVLPDNRVRIEVAGAWPSTAEARAALPGLVTTIKPQVFGWFPDGPAAALAADIKDRRKQGRRAWPPAGVKVEEIRAEVAAVCMGFAEQVGARRIAQSDDPLLNAQVGAAEKLKRGATWVFVRGSVAHVDAVYASAGAVHLARTLPPELGRFKIV